MKDNQPVYIRVLHTNSEYATDGERIRSGLNYDGTIGNEGLLELEAQITLLENREREFYQRFNCSNYDEFLTKVKRAFEEYEQDAEVFRRFQPSSLQEALNKFAGSHQILYNENVEMKFSIDEKDVKRILSKTKLSNGRQVLKKANDIALSIDMQNLQVIVPDITWNARNIKNVLNAIQRKRHFQTGKDTMTSLDKDIRDSLDADLLQINILNGDKQVSERYTNQLENFPWSITKDMYKSGQYTDLIEEGVTLIKNFIFDELMAGGSKILINTATSLWERKFRSLMDVTSFFNGGQNTNFKSGVQGALGEFAAALEIDYLNRKINDSQMGTASIVGDKLLQSVVKGVTPEQPKTDVEAFENIGFQVKNYSIFGEDIKRTFSKNIETNIHPYKLYPIWRSSDFYDFLANAYFNSDFASSAFYKANEPIAKEIVQEYLGYAMNMSVDESFPDSVLFYIFSNQYIVPCSVILRHMRDEMYSKSGLNLIKFQYGVGGLTDAQYREQEPYGGQYWYYSYANKMWKTKSKNQSTYDFILASKVKIVTQFNFWNELENYRYL